ncbi:MAG: sigma factor-like helix-turn-helix DNA-binding protein [Terriglobales bacterium]
MIDISAIRKHNFDLMAEAEVPPSVLFSESETDLWPYRARTVAMLRRYGRASVEVGRLPSLLGREFFRSRVTSYKMKSFEDTMVFVTDMEHTLERLDVLDKKLLAMYALEEHTISEISRALVRSERTVERLLHDAIDQLSKFLLFRGLLERLPRNRDAVSQVTSSRTH